MRRILRLRGLIGKVPNPSRIRHGGLPNLTLMRLMHDHTGNFSTAIDETCTPGLEVVDSNSDFGWVADNIARSIC